MADALRWRVRSLYKQLLYIGRDYPGGADYYRGKLKGAFLKKRDLQDPADIEKAIAHGEFVYRELEALWFVRKYRAMKRSYYDDSGAKLDSLLEKLDEKH